MQKPILHSSTAYTLSTYASIQLSFNLLPPPTQDFVSICAFLHHIMIPQALFEKVVDSEDKIEESWAAFPVPDDRLYAKAVLHRLFGEKWDEYVFTEISAPL